VNSSLNKPNHIASLATSSILVSVDIKVWTATKQDRPSADELTANKKADRNTARVTQHLLADDKLHKEIINYRQHVYNWMERLTYPWSGSQFLLPVTSLPKFMKEYAEHEAEFNKRKDAFMAEYQNIIGNMAFKMGDMFDRNSYPAPAVVQGKFSINLYTSEVPTGDYRVSISQELADDLHHNYERQAANLVNEVISKQAEQLIGVMQSIRNCCVVEEELDDKGAVKIKRKKIYDSTINRALELCDTYKSFNLTANPSLEEARKSLEDILSGVNIDALRDSDSMRTRVKDSLDEVLKKFS
jgi:hypothetical protein